MERAKINIPFINLCAFYIYNPIAVENCCLSTFSFKTTQIRDLPEKQITNLPVEIRLICHLHA